MIRGIIVLTYLFALYKIEIIFISNICLSVLSCLFEPAKQATLKNIVHQNHFVTANSLSNTINGFMSIMGASLGGILAQSLHIEFAFFINSLSYFIMKNPLSLNSMFMYMLFFFMSKYKGKRRFIFLTF